MDIPETPRLAAVFSVNDKIDVAGLIRGVAEEGWDVFASLGTRERYHQETGRQAQTLEELVAQETGVFRTDREEIAQRVSKIIRMDRHVRIVCVNLRPPKIVDGIVSPDAGGLFMLDATQRTQVVPVTNPELYGEVLEQIQGQDRVETELLKRLQQETKAHVAEHRAKARALKCDLGAI